MPAVTYLSDHEAAKGRSIVDDKDADELLQDLRRRTGEDWIILVRERGVRRGWFRREIVKDYELLVDVGGQWQVMNLVAENGGSVFGSSSTSRLQVMNFMLGYVCADEERRKHSNPVLLERTTQRGFAKIEFEDLNGVGCSIQASSLATQSAIWLGANEIGLKKFVPYEGWSDVPTPNELGGISHIANTRMHLSQEGVAKLLPVLQLFAETGELRRVDR